MPRPPGCGEREYLLDGFRWAIKVNGLAGVLAPFGDACRGLIAVWRATNPETGDLVSDFTDGSWDTQLC